jgi:hypothetical protein
MTIRRMAATGVAVVAALLMVVSTASAAAPSSSCRASALRAQLLSLAPVEPAVAGADSPAACETHGAGQDQLNVPLSPLLTASTSNIYAVTQSVKQNPLTVSELPSAAAGATNLHLILSGLDITADAVDSLASATCVNGQPSFSGSSKVVDLKLNGNDISLDQLIDAIAGVLNPTQIVSLHINQQVKTATSLVQTALHLQIAAGGNNILDLVIGESSVSTSGDVCALPPPPISCAPGTVLDPGTNTCVPNPTCPAGTTFDPTAHACVTNPPVCPAGTTFNPTANACVANPPNCPAGTQFDPGANACVPNASSCPAGSTFDPAKHTCVEAITKTITQTQTTQAGSGNGNIGSANGPLAHCGHLQTVLFTNNKKASLSQRYKGHDRVVIRGRLISCGSRPQSIIGAKIDVVHVINGVRHATKTGVKTRAHGRFTLILPRNIRTRSIEFNYRGDLNKSRIISRKTLHYTLRNSKGKTLR